MNQRKTGVILSYLHILLSNTISLIYTPYMLRIMGQSEYGLFGTASSFVSYLSVLSFGIGGAYVRFNAKCRAENDIEGEKRLNGMFLVVFSVLALFVLIGGICGIILAEKLVENTFTALELSKLRMIMLILTINMMVTFVFNVVTMALQAYEQYIFVRLVTLIAGIVNPIINIVALNMGGRAVAISLISFLCSMVCYLCYYLFARKVIRLRFSFSGFRKDVLLEIFTFSSFIFLDSITDQITFATDSIVLSSVNGTAAVAVYTIGASFKNYFQQISATISGVFGSMVNMLVAQKRPMHELDEVFIKVGRIQFYLVSLILIGFVSIGREFVCMWAGEAYDGAFYIAIMLMVALFVPAIQNIGVEIQKAMNMHRARSMVYFLIAIMNIILTIPLAMRYGGMGAAFATMISMFFGRVLFMNFYYQKYIGLNMMAFWKSIYQILPGFVLPICTGVMISRCWKIQSYMGILGAAVIISAVYFSSCWVFSFNTYEKQILVAAINRVLLRIKKNRK